MSEFKSSITARDFGVVTFTDHNGVECSIQQSSAIGPSNDAMDRPGSSMIWLGCNEADPQYLVRGKGWMPVQMPKQYIANTRMHLERSHVEELIKVLQTWLDTGEVG
jgi:hypothetical protein